MMMTQVDQPFSARIVEPPLRTSQPRQDPFLVLCVAVVGGFIIGVFLAFLADALRGSQARSRVCGICE